MKHVQEFKRKYKNGNINNEIVTEQQIIKKVLNNKHWFIEQCLRMAYMFYMLV